VDRVSLEDRSRIMRAVGREDTTPELSVRRIAHKLGFRFRLHRKDLPGSPDIIFPKHRLCLFVHGCFWHRHHGCRKATTPKSNAAFWMDKFARNVERDARKVKALRALGWKVAVVWECQSNDETIVESIIRDAIR
jgi:DNA mismatch endonuclease, patch repair protein